MAVLNQLSAAISIHRLAIAMRIYSPVETKGEEWIVDRLRRQYELERDNPEPVPYLGFPGEP